VAASLGAFPAVVVVHGVFFALGATSIADFGAKGAKFVHELRVAGLQAGAEGAKIGAIAAELGAKGQFSANPDVFRGAMFAAA